MKPPPQPSALSCECKIDRRPHFESGIRYGHNYSIVYCELHQSAPSLLEALEESHKEYLVFNGSMKKHEEDHPDCEICQLIRAAKGKQ